MFHETGTNWIYMLDGNHRFAALSESTRGSLMSFCIWSWLFSGGITYGFGGRAPGRCFSPELAQPASQWTDGRRAVQYRYLTGWLYRPQELHRPQDKDHCSPIKLRQCARQWVGPPDATTPTCPNTPCSPASGALARPIGGERVVLKKKWNKKWNKTEWDKHKKQKIRQICFVFQCFMRQEPIEFTC